MTVRQLCGLRCLPQDPGYRPDEVGQIITAYTQADLRRLEGY